MCPNRYRCSEPTPQNYAHLHVAECFQHSYGRLRVLEKRIDRQRSLSDSAQPGVGFGETDLRVALGSRHLPCARIDEWPRRITPHLGGFLSPPEAKFDPFRLTATTEPPTSKQLAASARAEIHRISPHQKKEKNSVGRNSKAWPQTAPPFVKHMTDRIHIHHTALHK
jgi:hypothetical protein